MKLCRPIKMCLNEICSNIHMGKNPFDAFPIQNGLKRGALLLPLTLNYAVEYAIRKDWI
jgi:hypothetical protein